MGTIIAKLCQNVLCFARNYRSDIIILVLTTTLIQSILDYILIPKKTDLTFMNNFIGISLQDTIRELSVNQQCILLQLFAANSISKLLSSTFLFGSILTMLNTLSTSTKHNKYLNIKKIVQSAIPTFPKLLLLIFYMTLSVQLGIMIAIIPGILLAIIISLAPIIIITEKLSITKSLYLSIKISYHNIHLIILPVLLWFLMKTIIVLTLVHHFYSWIFIAKILINSFNNMLSAIILIYLYRLYMIVKII